MKIIDKRENGTCILSRLHKGDSFIMRKEDYLTTPYLHVGEDDNDNTAIEAVSISNGNIYSIDKSTLVEPVELTIEVYGRSTE